MIIVIIDSEDRDIEKSLCFYFPNVHKTAEDQGKARSLEVSVGFPRG